MAKDDTQSGPDTEAAEDTQTGTTDAQDAVEAQPPTTPFDNREQPKDSAMRAELLRMGQ